MALVPVKETASEAFNVDAETGYRIQKNLVNEWEPRYEVWPLSHGNYIIGALATISGMGINAVFRKRLRLLNHGMISSMCLIGPSFGVLAAASHEFFVTQRIMLYRTQCTLCESAKAALSLNIHSVLLPLIAAPALGLIIAGNIGYRVPPLREIREVSLFWWTVVRPEAKKIGLVLLGHAMIANLIVYKQFKSMNLVTDIIERVYESAEEEQTLPKN